MTKKALSPEKAAAKISTLIANNDVKTAEEAVKQHPELAPGLEHFEKEKPVSKGSGPAVYEHPRR